jgi:hypothetical protein
MTLEVQFCVGDGAHIGTLAVPNDASVHEVVALISEQLCSVFTGISVSDQPIPLGDAFVDYFEPDSIYKLTTHSGLFSGSMAEAYSGILKEWRPELTNTTLIVRGTGHDVKAVNAFIDAALGHANTFTFMETECGKSICGGFLARPWALGDVKDPEQGSFLFTLKNHLGRTPMKFPKKANGRAACALRGIVVGFDNSGMFLCDSGGSPSGWGSGFDTMGCDFSFITGGQFSFRAGRWEIWETT